MGYLAAAAAAVVAENHLLRPEPIEIAINLSENSAQSMARSA